MTTKTFTFAPAEGITANIRAAEIDGAWWFVAADVCRALGLNLNKGSDPHTKGLDASQKRTIKAGAFAPETVPGTKGRGGLRATSLLAIVSESGLYRLVMRSDKPEARQFQDWVTRDVLPAIRKDGAYVMGEEKALAAPAEPMHACGAPGSQGRSGPSHSLACTGAYGG